MEELAEGPMPFTPHYSPRWTLQAVPQLDVKSIARPQASAPDS